VTQFVLLLSAYALLLSHEMGRDDVIVGTDVANRRLPELEPMIGFFVNLLALRVRIDDGESIAAFVARVGALTLQSYENQDVPFDQVVAALNHPRDARFGPLFQHKLVFQNAPVPALDLAGVRVEPWSDERHAAELDMVVTAWNNADGFGLRIEYNSELFSERMCDDWLDKLRWLIGRIAASEDTVAALREGLRARDQERRRQAGQAAVRQLAGTRRRAVGLAETTDINGSES
jgi:non-ribosomal peptide synthetase component F